MPNGAGQPIEAYNPHVVAGTAAILVCEMV